MWPESPEMQTMAGFGVFLAMTVLFLMGCGIVSLRRQRRRNRAIAEVQRERADKTARDKEFREKLHRTKECVKQLINEPDPGNLREQQVKAVMALFPSSETVDEVTTNVFRTSGWVPPELLDEAVRRHNTRVMNDPVAQAERANRDQLRRRMNRPNSWGDSSLAAVHAAHHQFQAMADTQQQMILRNMGIPPGLAGGVSSRQAQPARDQADSLAAAFTSTDIMRERAAINEETRRLSQEETDESATPEEREALSRPAYRTTARRQGRTEGERLRQRQRVSNIAFAEATFAEGLIDAENIAWFRERHPGFDVADLNEAVRQRNERVEAVRQAQQLGQAYAPANHIEARLVIDKPETQEMPKQGEPRRKLTRKEKP